MNVPYGVLTKCCYFVADPLSKIATSGGLSLTTSTLFYILIFYDVFKRVVIVANSIRNLNVIPIGSYVKLSPPLTAILDDGSATK